MEDMKATGDLSALEISAVVIRADGSREDLGTISYWNKSLRKRIQRRILTRLLWLIRRRHGNCSS
jgi:hypothetical protein